MAKVDDLMKSFLDQKRIAVVGISDKRETGCNLAYKKFKENGYQVYAVNPRISTYDGDVCYADLKSVPDNPEAVFILANPKVTEQIVGQCVEMGIKHIWMHCMMGTKPGFGTCHDAGDVADLWLSVSSKLTQIKRLQPKLESLVCCVAPSCGSTLTAPKNCFRTNLIPDFPLF